MLHYTGTNEKRGQSIDIKTATKTMVIFLFKKKPKANKRRTPQSSRYSTQRGVDSQEPSNILQVLVTTQSPLPSTTPHLQWAQSSAYMEHPGGHGQG